MCQQLIPKTKMLCGHEVEELPTVMPYRGCGGCGVIQHREYMGQTTKRIPCDGCIADRSWVEVEGEWMSYSDYELLMAALQEQQEG